ncbi:MAG: FCD domain-containing protein [Alphaproteobacteria bacterium]|jgi:DNA-binding GntR family transcriptional regulator|nr:FCD domain-containing protein [Alphaproteobacteria bacterium]
MIEPQRQTGHAPLRPDAGDATAVAEMVADVLRERIVKGQLTPGDRIVERKLSDELNVSRTPIREALKLLRVDGLIEISRHRGAEVAGYTPAEALDLFDVIASLESLAARRLAETITPDVLDHLEILHARMTEYHRTAALEPYFDTNSKIHALVIASCGNPVLIASHSRLMLRAMRGRFMAIMDDNRWSQAVDEHDQLMAALRARDVDRAAQVWGVHLRHTGATVSQMLEMQIAGASRID